MTAAIIYEMSVIEPIKFNHNAGKWEHSYFIYILIQEGGTISSSFNSLGPKDAYKLTIIGSDNGLSPGRRQAIILTNAGIWSILTLGNKFQLNVNRNSNIFIQENAIENFVFEMASILSRPQCINSCNAESILGIIKIYLHLL